MKKILLTYFSIFILYACGGPTQQQQEVINAQAQLEKDLEMYRYVWGEFFKNKYLNIYILTIT